MAESSDARKADSSQTQLPQPPPQITLLQPQHVAGSSKDLQVAVAKNAATGEFGDDPEPQEPLPPWFQKYFPLLSANETFLVVYVYMVVVVATIKEAFLVDLFKKWLYFVQFLFSPTILVAKWTLWIVKSFTFKPVLYVVLAIAGFLGITKALTTLAIAIIAAVDSSGDKLMTTAGTVAKYVKEQWDETKNDFIEAFKKLKKWAKETLEAMVRALKYIRDYVSNMLKMILPESFYKWALQWLTIGCILLSKFYSFSKNLLITFEKVLDIIKNAWNNTPKPPPEESAVFSSDPKLKEQLKPSVAQSKHVEAVTTTPTTVPEDSTKQRKA